MRFLFSQPKRMFCAAPALGIKQFPKCQREITKLVMELQIELLKHRNADRKIEITKNKSNRRLMKQKNTHFRLKGLLLYSDNGS